CGVRAPEEAGMPTGPPLLPGRVRPDNDGGRLAPLLGTPRMSDFHSVVDSPDDVYSLTTRTRGPDGKLPLTDDLLRHAPSGHLFGWTQNVGMGLRPDLLGRPEFLILSTHGGLRA